MPLNSKNFSPGSSWPELSKSEMRKLLREIGGVEEKELHQADLATLKTVFARTLAEAHSVPLADCSQNLVPNTFNRC